MRQAIGRVGVEAHIEVELEPALFFSMNEVKKRRLRITRVENDDPQRLTRAAVVSGHFLAWRLHHRLTGFHCYRLTPLEFQCEYPFQDVSSVRLN